MSNLKDIITTVLAILTVIGTAVQAYFQANSGDINWLQLLMQVGGAVVMYFVGKNADGSTKSAQQLAKQMADK